MRSMRRVRPIVRRVLRAALVVEPHLLKDGQLDLQEAERIPADRQLRLGDDGGGEQAHRLHRVLGGCVVDVTVDVGHAVDGQRDRARRAARAGLQRAALLEAPLGLCLGQARHGCERIRGRSSPTCHHPRVPTLDAISVIVSDLRGAIAFYRHLGLVFPDLDADDHGHVETTLPGGLRLMLNTEATVRSFMPDWTPPTGGRRVGTRVPLRLADGRRRAVRRAAGSGRPGAPGAVGHVLGPALRRRARPGRQRRRSVRAG